MTLSEAAYNLLNTLVGGRSTNNEYYSIEQIKYNIKYYRSLLIRRETDRLGGQQTSGGGQGGSHNSGTSLVELCQNLELTLSEYDPPSGVDTFPNNTLDNTFVGDSPIPRYVRPKGRSGIVSVTHNGIGIPIIYSGEAIFRKYNKYTPTRWCCYFDKNRNLIVINFDSDSDPVVEIAGIFEDPEEAYGFNNPEDPWDDDINEFPLPMDMYQGIVQSLLSGEFRIMIQTPNDTKQDHLPDKEFQRS